MEANSIRLDADQRRAATWLDGLLDRRRRPLKRHRGVYLHGRPGRGKTMVMDRFFATVDSNLERRFHFHTFFAALHTEVHASGSIDTAIDTLLGKARLVCFDEFHVHDIGDAMLITRMLDALFARHLTLVVTSNYAPSELLPNPLFHDHFVPTIDRIVAELDVLTLDGPLDYRTITGGAATGFRAGRYIVGPDPVSDWLGGCPASSTGPNGARPEPPSSRGNRLDRTSAEAADWGGRARAREVVETTDSDPRIEVAVGNRTIRARSADADAITVDFADLCATPTSAADYVHLAERFHTWTLLGVPLLREVPPDWAMRLVNLVDVLYDADRPLTVYADAPVADLVDGAHSVPDIARAASRLGELSQTRRSLSVS
ncbi:cell division protein ZapE [Nocardia cyriacigeorgica]|uniref:Cell division protein ZapE n=1 Tax=Nocardia cyriacigeorgica TaxID=135487 RepID=A0A6P1D2N2_9NOCA|nr:cell division protein ZapE [Nocardia cyriacigeorgica]NEW42113.1 cell division protein ZapE [Nocardia cyriacigeorgica]NEW44845.1 cell division protein ZapE [Nocardia cyriacigeorgica]NEW53081.1 cell division protein ZapE [Nocardia cyriacigeorgica]